MDPAAATAAWLDKIPAAQRAAAHAATERELLTFFLGGLITLAATWIIVRSGWLTRLRIGIEAGRPRPWIASLAVAGGFMLALLALQAPLELARTGMAWNAVLQEDLLRLLLGLVLLPLALFVIRRAPRFWWAWLGGIAAAAVVAIVFAPYALASGAPPLPRLEVGPTRTALADVTRRAGIDEPAFYLSGNGLFAADVTGLPGAPRITLVRDGAYPVPEVKAELAHVLSHYRHLDQLGLALVMAALAFAGFVAARFLFPPVARLMGARDISGPADPAGLPVLAAIAVLWLGVATPAIGAYNRWINLRADAEALAWSREPDGLAGWLVRDWNRADVAPSPLAQALLYTHPPIAGRIRRAMDWKAAHPAR